MNIPSYISWKRVKYSIIWLLLTSESAFAAGAFNRAQTNQNKQNTTPTNNDEWGLFDLDFWKYWEYLFILICPLDFKCKNHNN